MADLPPLREVIRAHGLRAEKALGQNFLLDQNITDKIVRLSGKVSGIHAVEIGPGPGGLTRAILDSEMARLVAVEFDPRAVGALQDLVTAYGADRFQILEADALEVLPYALVPAPRAVLSNLPYNISTVLLLKWLAHIRADKDVYAFMSLMFQKEVGDRILAQVGTKAYGRLSVMAQWLCTVRRLFDLPPSAFTPPPKVKSGVLRLKNRWNPPACDHRLLFRVVKAAFNQRRKMLSNALGQVLPEGYSDRMNILHLRAEQLPVQAFVELTQAIEETLSDQKTSS